LREACPKFEESYRLDPALGALLNLASCHELLGLTATAWSEYREAEDLALRAGDESRRKFAAKHAEALADRIPRVRITLDQPVPGLVVRRDGVELGEATIGTAIPIDPGAHTISAAAPGYAPWTTKIEAETGKETSVSIPALTALPEDDELTSRAGDSAQGNGSGQRTAGFIIGGVGVAALGAGAVFGVLTANQAATAEEECQGLVCRTQAGDDAVARGNTYGWISNISFGVGALGLVVGGVLVLTARSGDPPPAPAAGVSVVPLIGAHGAGLRAAGVF
jgi:hypothetical protein